MLIANLKELEDKKDVKTYSCGSQRLSHAIRTQLNMVPVQTYEHKKTGKLINVYIMTKELSDFLTQWTKNRPNKNSEVSNG